jgi:hypothetical protein
MHERASSDVLIVSHEPLRCGRISEWDEEEKLEHLHN